MYPARARPCSNITAGDIRIFGRPGSTRSECGRQWYTVLPTVLLSVRVVLLSLAAGRPRLLYRPGPGRRPCGGSAPGGRMTRRLVVGDLRVQRLDRRNGLRSWTIVWPEGTVHEEADRFLRVHDGSGTQKTYAYSLVDHLRWHDRV